MNLRVLMSFRGDIRHFEIDSTGHADPDLPRVDVTAFQIYL
jgi:hypothetical protein